MGLVVVLEIESKLETLDLVLRDGDEGREIRLFFECQHDLTQGEGVIPGEVGLLTLHYSCCAGR